LELIMFLLPGSNTYNTFHFSSIKVENYISRGMQHQLTLNKQSAPDYTETN